MCTLSDAYDEVGGWDTTIRKEQYEKLFYNQQSSMTKVDSDFYSKTTETANKKAEQGTTETLQPHSESTVQSRPVNETTTAQSPSVQSMKEDSELNKQFENIAVDSTVVHKKFGKGTVVKINKNEKFIYVRFALGEKKFMFPSAFLSGFLKIM